MKKAMPALMVVLWRCLLFSMGTPAQQPGMAGSAGNSTRTFTTFDAPGAGTGAYQGRCPGRGFCLRRERRTWPCGINSVGAIGGYYLDASTVYHGFIRAADGAMITFDAPGAGTGIYKGTLGMSINTTGAVAEFYYDATEFHHGFVRAATGAVTTFDDPGAGGTAAYGINAEGSIVGDAEFLVGPQRTTVAFGFVRAAKNGAITTFHAPHADQTLPYGINALGAIVGYYWETSGAFHGFLVTP